MADGTFGGGTGVSNDPYIIEDAADLDAIRTKPAGYFKLKNNINLDVAPYNSAGWTPIPNLTGQLDGDGYVIKYLKINSPTISILGLIANLSGAVKDLGVVNVDITGNEKVGAIAGRFFANSASIARCYSTGSIKAKNIAGGLVGDINQLNVTLIQDSRSSTNIVIEEDFAGGIAGYVTSPFATNKNKVYNCFYNGNITGGNLLTAGPIYGYCENIDVQGCFYDKEKTMQKNDLAIGLTTTETQNKLKFDAWLYRYRNNVPVWKFLDNNAPKLWFEDLGRAMIVLNGQYYIYNTTTESWQYVSDARPDRATFWEQGMKDLEGIPIAKFKELEVYGSVDIVNVVESGAQGANTKIKTQLIFDVLRTNKSLYVQSFVEDPLPLDGDFNPVNRGLNIEQEDREDNDAMGVDIVSQTEATVDPKALIGRPNQINGKSTLIIVDDEQESTILERGITVNFVGKSSESASTFTSLLDTGRSIEIDSSDEATVTGVDINIVSEAEKPVDPEKLTGRNTVANTKDIIVTTDRKLERNNIEGNAVYEIYKTITKTDRAIKVDTKGEGKSRYLMSVNNGGKWLTYSPDTRSWVETELRSISDNGITINQMADEKIWDSLPSDYRSKIKYAVGIRNESFNSTHKIGKLDIEFMPNQGPLVQDGQVQVLTDRIALIGTLFDAENDAVEYQVVTKQFNEIGWRQITPEQPGWFKRKNGYQFYHEYDFTSFRAGDNTIKVITRDSRGVIYEKEFQIILITGEPQIELNFQNEFYMNATINHSLSKKVRFRILVNSNQITPLDGYTDWKEAGFTFDFSWDSKDLLYGLPNEITIEAVDELNTKAEIKFHVLGGYRSLLFKDENNFYYSTDKGDILQQLDFGTVIGGLFAEPRIVFLENRTGLTLEDVSIWADNETQEEKVKLMLSETLSPFVPVETISLTNTMANSEVKPFYVRIESEIDVQSIQRKVFKIYAKGDPVAT
ncbi:hypothetical protein [Anaerospora hongkongensis]|uniref:hypothetical protein n=1 Tax=Anaerospora hongkongensis TaxID=244830 RepID=UPI0028A0F1AB|nr:hypothetical protein [Anaerospora hongkongensis]